MKTFHTSAGFAKKSFGDRPSYGPKRGRPSFGARDTDRLLEMHQATCNSCHKPCEVPFRPNGKKPVYCRDCFRENEHAQSFAHALEGAPSEGGSGDLKKQLNVLNTKLDRLIAVIEAQTRVLSSSSE